jgi:WD40 repeat protein
METCRHTSHRLLQNDRASCSSYKRIATGSEDQTIKLWDAATGEEVFTLRGQQGTALGLAFSPDGHKLASGGMDWTVKVWDATPLDARAGQGPAVPED